MLVLVTYDVRTEMAAGRKRLRRVARTFTNYGQRVQKSVFECLVDPAQWISLGASLIHEKAPDEDSLRFYFLCANWKPRVELVGANDGYDPEGPLLV